jgi:acyl-coenzyme A thioesterase PaaI-like protein
LREGEHVTRPWRTVAGRVRFALADVAARALILLNRKDEASVGGDLIMNFLCLAMLLPLVAAAMLLLAGRRLDKAGVRTTKEATGRLATRVAPASTAPAR